MNLSLNGQSRIPPGFRFHPTEEELLDYYLKKKVAYEKIELDVIQEIDLNKLEPWDIQEKCKIGSTKQNEWYFFSHKDRKYPTGTRTNRATIAGFWKATGRDKIIYSGIKQIGMRKTLVFYTGRAPHGLKSDWIMHEFRLNDTAYTNFIINCNASNSSGVIPQEEGWVICRLFKKKNHYKTVESSKNMEIEIPNSINECDQNQNLHSIKSSTSNNIMNTAIINGIHERFLILPALESPNYDSLQNLSLSSLPKAAGVSDWATMDRLVAYQLNGQLETLNQQSFFTPNHDLQLQQLRSSLDRSYQSMHEFYSSEIDIWSFNGSSPLSSDPVFYVSGPSI